MKHARSIGHQHRWTGNNAIFQRVGVVISHLVHHNEHGHTVETPFICIFLKSEDDDYTVTSLFEKFLRFTRDMVRIAMRTSLCEFPNLATFLSRVVLLGFRDFPSYIP